MILVDKEVTQFASWPTRERIRALKRIIPRQMWKLYWHVAAERGGFAAAFPVGLWSGS